jgi:transcriptional regulator with XRE-family HTH domain
MDVATLITQCRHRAGLTQRELARRADTSAAAVCLYERGDRVPRIDTLTRLVAATGSTLDLAAAPPPALDHEANARTLEDLLDLADHLPQRSSAELAAPPFAALARRNPR